MNVSHSHRLQQQFFKTGASKELHYRTQSLQRLKNTLETREQDVYNALKKDLGKSEFEAYVTEYNVVMAELRKFLYKLKRWTKPKKVRAALLNFPSQARQYPEPYGNVLVISPWNYPFQLALAPVIGAVGAGNTVVLKPSEFAPHTSQLLEEIIATSFSPEHVTVCKGDAAVAKELTSLKWDYIFFTGSPQVGKLIYQAAAQHLTPVTLELGGKNPCVVHQSAAIKTAAKRIVWAKFLNAGQTCIAPDYILVHASVKQELVKQLQISIAQFYGEQPQSSHDYGRINRKDHLEKLLSYLDGEQLITGGDYNLEQLYLAPTLLDEPGEESAVMQQEIFGPILPVISYQEQDDIEKWIHRYEKPLSGYVFATQKSFINWFTKRYSYGGGVINDCIVHFVNDRLPFGGVGNSGIGAYHGKHSFDCFSHYKSVVHRKNWLDITLKYPPYAGKLKATKSFLKRF